LHTHPKATRETESHNDPRHERWLDIASTLLLALAAVATAWASYQAARWHGEQASSFSKANAARIESTRASDLANRQVPIDVTTFEQWVDAYAQDETELADFYRRRFRDEFKPAVDAWIATRPLQNPAAPQSPFAMPEYRLAANEDATRLETEAAQHSDQANKDIERADQYVLCVVLFAASLFFAGMSTRLRTGTARTAVFALGCTVFLGTIAWLATFPVST
jgi:hypothetical protein